jgi:tetratricopeptide (TPR) repeat protein
MEMLRIACLLKRDEMGNDVFICYSRKDEDFVLKLAENLKKKGVPVWLDQWDIPPGADWDQTIEKALDECTSLLLVISPSSVESEEVRSEWRSVLDKEKVVVPILYQPCEIPYRLKSIQYIDFTSHSPDDKESIDQILNALGKLRSTLIKTVTQQEQTPKRPVKNTSVPTKSAESQTKTEKFDARVNKKTALIAFIVLGSLIMFTCLVPVNEFIKNLKAPENHSKFENASAWYDKGHAFYEQGNHDEAIQAFDMAIELVSRQLSSVG